MPGVFKKIRDTKGTFHAKMGSIKDRNGMDLTEAEDIKKRWQEYTLNLSHQLPTTHLQVCPWNGIVVELHDDWERAGRPETGRKFNFSKVCWKL